MNDSPKLVRQPYRSPELRSLGKLTELTRGQAPPDCEVLVYCGGCPDFEPPGSIPG